MFARCTTSRPQLGIRLASACATLATLALIHAPPALAQTSLVARELANGEVLLEWPAQSNAGNYRIERTALGLPPVILDSGRQLNAMDFGGIADSYTYRLLVRGLDGVEREASRLTYRASAALLARKAAAAGKPPQLRAAIGTNLNGITYYSPQVPFVDVMKASSDWISGDSSTWNNGQAVDVDANGWVKSLAPGQIARTLLLREIDGKFPAGEYLVRYRGDGTMSFGGSATVVPGSQRTGQLSLQVTPNKEGIHLYITATNSANYLRDIEIIMPGGICEGDHFRHVTAATDCGSRRFLSFADYGRSLTFYPVFLDRIRNYSVLRFMDWMKTNGRESNPNPVTGWANRTPLSYRTWAKDSGAPVEVLVALANRVGAHPWLNIPHQSDTGYAQNLAQTLKARLDASLGVYVEHSNEVWNYIFPQAAYATAQGAAATPAIDAMQYHALRTRTIGLAFKGVLGNARAAVVLATQAGNPWTATRGLSYLSTRFGASALGIDAVAIAPYVGVTPTPATADQFTSMSLAQFFNHVRQTVLPQAISTMSSYKAIADTYRINLLAYEGGQHMVGRAGAENNAALNALFDAFNRDPAIGALYLDYLAAWRNAGGRLFVNFIDISRYDKWGDWGSLEYITQARSQAPKFDALQTFIETNPVWWTQ